MAVDRCQVVALVPVEWGGLRSGQDCFLDFSSCPVGFSGQHLAVVESETMTCILAVFTYCCEFLEVPVLFELFL